MITTNNTENIGSIKRKICGQWFIDFPKDIEPTKLKVYAYDLGNKCKTLTIANFESITFIDWYNCQVTGRKFIKALGLNNKKVTVLWLS